MRHLIDCTCALHYDVYNTVTCKAIQCDNHIISIFQLAIILHMLMLVALFKFFALQSI